MMKQYDTQEGLRSHNDVKSLDIEFCASCNPYDVAASGVNDFPSHKPRFSTESVNSYLENLQGVELANASFNIQCWAADGEARSLCIKNSIKYLGRHFWNPNLHPLIGVTAHLEYLGDCINKNVWDYAGRKKSTIYISQLTALRTKFNKRIQEVRRADIICKVFHYHRYFSLPIPAWIWGEAIKLLPVKQGEDTNYDLLELDFWTRVKLFFSGYFKQAFSPTNMHIKADSLIQQKYSSLNAQLPNTVDSSLNLSRCPGAV